MRAQVHLFIFEMAVVHILGGIALIVFASARMRAWRRWTDADDACAALCAPYALPYARSASHFVSHIP